MLTPALLPSLETSEQLTPEEEAEETEAWAKPLSQLWQNRPPNFEAEKEFNETMAQQAPHCSVCMIFQTYHQVSPRRPLCLPRTSSQREARFNCGYIACHWSPWEGTRCWCSLPRPRAGHPSRADNPTMRVFIGECFGEELMTGFRLGGAPWHAPCLQRNLLFCHHSSQLLFLPDGL